MTALPAGLALAVTGSAALNVSYLLQHAGSRTVAELSWRRPTGAARALLGSRRWLAGALLGAAGWLVTILAIGLAPLSWVQAFAAGGLALAVPLASRLLGQPLPRPAQIVVAALVLSVAVLAVGAPSGDPRSVPATGLAVALFTAATFAAALAVLGPRLRPGVALGACSGALYGAADAAIKAVTVDVHTDGARGLMSPWLAVVAVLSVAAFGAFQRGLQVGAAVPVIAVMTGGSNAVAILIGLLALGEPAGAGPVSTTVHVLALCAAIACAAALAGTQERLTTEASSVAKVR